MDDSDWGLIAPLHIEAPEVSDDALLAAMVEVERALTSSWAAVLGAAAPADEVPAVPSAEELDAVFDAEALSRETLQHGVRRDGVVVPELARLLRERAEAAGIPGGLIHRGATSQDILDTAMMLVGVRALTSARDDLALAGRVLSQLAAAERETPTIAITLGQSAAPSTWGVTAAGWLDGLSSALETLDALSYPIQLGGAVGTAEALAAPGVPDAPERLRAAVANQLGLADPGRSWHTERTPVLRVATAAAGVCAATGRIGRQLTLLVRPGGDEVRFASAGGSSAMPHKRNPVDAVALVAHAVEAPGLLATVYSGAVSSDGRPAGEWHAESPALRGLLRLAAGSAAALASALDGLELDHSAITRNYLRESDRIGTQATPATFTRSDRIVSIAVSRFDRSTQEIT